jgi:hypothetical protein
LPKVKTYRFDITTISGSAPLGVNPLESIWANRTGCQVLSSPSCLKCDHQVMHAARLNWPADFRNISGDSAFIDGNNYASIRRPNALFLRLTA